MPQTAKLLKGSIGKHYNINICNDSVAKTQMHRQQKQKHRPIGLCQIKKVAYNSGKNKEDGETTKIINFKEYHSSKLPVSNSWKRISQLEMCLCVTSA